MRGNLGPKITRGDNRHLPLVGSCHSLIRSCCPRSSCEPFAKSITFWWPSRSVKTVMCLGIFVFSPGRYESDKIWVQRTTGAVFVYPPLKTLAELHPFFRIATTYTYEPIQDRIKCRPLCQTDMVIVVILISLNPDYVRGMAFDALVGILHVEKNSLS